ncbi:alkaline D-peptidase [Paractinoplanes tereljensis]|uniref:Alkaline D-peptidase n=2 Tax=Paractinoplanes tereljensis TaxID=571912 RepID=A0A919NHF8_9ACTN|nr:alkaline D-peptidase [Actinoplanes tereljensis]
MTAGYANAAGVTWLGDAAEEAETVVSIAAAGRWIVATCVAILVRQGDLDPNLPVRTLLPELPAWAAPIRLHHLIHHTSGLPGEAVPAGRGDWIEGLSRPEAEPGTVFSDSDIGYACLAILAERAAGRPVAEIAQKHLFTPLGMASTQFRAGPSGDEVWSTARDMLRWAEAMHIGALGPRLTAVLRQPGKLRDGAFVPYAWGSHILPGERGPAFAHTGRSPGCVTFVIASPATATSAIVIALTDDPEPAESLGKQLVGLTG